MKRVVTVSSAESGKCDHCSELLDGIRSFADAINHYVSDHQYVVLSVGQQSTHHDGKQLWHSTVAVLGSPDPPPLQPPQVVFKESV
jgi:hypothetical protein